MSLLMYVRQNIYIDKYVDTRTLLCQWGLIVLLQKELIPSLNNILLINQMSTCLNLFETPPHLAIIDKRCFAVLEACAAMGQILHNGARSEKASCTMFLAEDKKTSRPSRLPTISILLTSSTKTSL